MATLFSLVILFLVHIAVSVDRLSFSPKLFRVTRFESCKGSESAVIQSINVTVSKKPGLANCYLFSVVLNVTEKVSEPIEVGPAVCLTFDS